MVVGFPLLTALALERLTSSHGAVVIALLPAATAAWAVARAGERPGRGFWLASAGALAAVLVFSATRGAGLPTGADWLLLAAVVVCSCSSSRPSARGSRRAGRSPRPQAPEPARAGADPARW